ncbi:MAG: hypothetical protein GKC05_01285 [Methanomicrobiales archaeon]|nr:hypothetical protein [Methanomicrobiales archaeon]NYT21258.1 hypothetical protein [Methanomicrobiales archaeon]
MIRKILLLAGIVYIAVSMAQIIQRPSTAPEGVVIGAALLVVVSFFYMRDEPGLAKWEGAAIWLAVFLFVIYGILRYAGVL